MSSSIYVRLVFAPVAAVLLLAGGVYWLRMHPLPGSGIREQAPSTILVNLIPRPDPAPIPIPTPSPTAADRVAAFAPPSQDVRDEAPVAVAPDPSGGQARHAPTPAIESPATALPASRMLMQFQQELLQHIARYQRYPNAARRNHLLGTVETFFSMRRDGTLLDVWVKTSSGRAVLDREAIETVRRAQPLPPIPPELPNYLNVQVSLAFDPF